MGVLLQSRQQHDTAAYRTVREQQLSSWVVWHTFQQSKGKEICNQYVSGREGRGSAGLIQPGGFS